MMRSLSYHINHLFLELGKAMLFASRRENSPVNLSPAVISVANNIASIVLEHLNFEGHSVSFERDMTVTTKCRYLGKVVEFVDGMLLDRPESCNSIMVNSFYCRGVIQAILTTFQATSELLFTMSRPPSSPMETDSKTGKDGKEMDSSWIYGPLTSYGAIMDHLVTSSFILSSSTRQLLEQPIFNGSVRFPQDAETFMKLLQSKVLKTVLPIWAHPQFPECNIELISSVMSIMRHVCSGVEVKDTVGNGGARLAGPPPDESAISLIVEMGFSRARAEEALRQVGTNSVEIATDWLFAHPEEPQEEDDELARALAMSLGNSVTPAQEGDSRSNDLELEEATVQPPPIDEMLRSCLQLLQRKEALAFSVRDMLVTISSQNDGQNRVKVLTYLIDNLKQCVVASEPSNDTALSALLHVLALILHGDTAAREVASKAGLVKVALDLLCSWEVQIRESSMIEVPNWVISCFLSVDQMLQLEPKLPDVTELHVLKRDNSNIKTSLVIDDSKRKDSESLPNVGLLDMEDQFQLLKICCKCIGKQLPSASMHAILQLSATLTKVHAAAICFLESGGLNALLSLPTSSLFSGFNNMASTIIRHILEDPHTLQQAMELEIRHSLVTAANRHANPRVTPRNFIQNLAFVVYRDPVIFMKAAQSVCQIEMVGDRPYVVLLKDREKERIKEKDKDKSVDKDKATVAVTKVVSGDTAAGSPANSHGKQSDLNSRNVKSHRKPPQSFVTVIEHLLDLLMSFVPPPRPEDQVDVSGTALSSDMDIDCSSAKGKGKAVSVPPEESKHAIQESTASLAKTAFFLKLLTDVLLTYASSIHVVLRHDAELSNMHGPNRTSARLTSGGIFNHILQHFLPHATRQKKERKNDGDWMYKLATRANQFLVASSIRSAEARKRIFSEICSIFLDFTDSSAGYNAPVPRMNVYVDLLNDILSARSPTGSSLSAESAVIFVEAGLVHSLSTMLQVLDLDHPDSAKIVTAVVKALELVSKEHIHSADNAKGVNSSKIASDSNNVNSSSNRFQALDMTSQPTEMVTDHRETFNAVRTSQISDSVADEMDHDRDMDGGFARDGEDDFMHEMAEDGTGDGSTMEIRIEIPRNREDDMAPAADDTDEDISAEDGEDDEDEDEENNNLEEDDAHRMSHPDTDQEDREMDEEEFDEDLLEEDDEDEDEEGVILRLEEGINGINVLDHVEVFGGSNNLSGDTLRVMPLDIFGTRRQGRSTSIYNLLGRASDHGVLDHPLLEEPSSTTNFSDQGHPENLVEMAFSDRNHESSSSRLDAIFRSLRSGRNGHRFNMWLDDGPQRNGSANGTAVLRVVQALSSLVNTLQERKDPEQPAEKDHSDAVSQISEINTALDSLWLELSNCISKIESSSEYASNLSPASASAAMLTTGVAPPLPAGTQNLLPYIESFFVTCEKLRPGQPDAVQDASTSDMEDASTSSGGQRSSACQASLDEKQNAFVKFSEKHRRLLNAFIRQNSGLLEKSFSLMLKIPRLIDFDNKRAYFRSKIKHQYDHHHHSPVRISVRRPYILEDSYNQLRMRSPQDLKGRLTVQFQGEEGIDAGGLTREWYQSISRVIVDKSALLFTTVGNDLTFQPNPNSVYQTEHLSYFKFVGRVVGKALFDGQLLDAHFTRSFYKHILGVKVTYHDIEAIDPSYYKNLKWMLENDISDVLDLTFSMDADEEKLILYEKAEVTDCELIPGGRNIRVTEENKHEYVDRVAEHRLTTAIRPQINAFLEGFNELIPRELISIFNDKELELLISGLPDIDLDDLKTNTEYSGYSIASPVVQWFWEIVQGFSKEDKARFLQFVTGTSKVPLEGFSELQGISGPQRFQIHKAYGSTNHLPSAHTCFNQLDLPEYTSKEQLQERLLLAIHEANEGFGFG
ncbi:E3 ubiquitin-protein ligase UPL1 [Zea mays]|uniref:HECT-type E3 ubiquitin transferase n=1 Tax=Zea mays TaxID=4577 RepID=A0A1D6IVM4_MAIZE|nr:E3 ubiquitin-protein ligase UPL1 [Zea mays]